MKNTISREDVLQVAKDLQFEPTEEQIDEVLEMYPSEQIADPTAIWNLVVEHFLDSLDVKQYTRRTYKIWLTIEVHTEYEDGEESYEDFEEEIQSAGEYPTLEEAIEAQTNIHQQIVGDYTE